MDKNSVAELSQEELEGRIEAILAVAPSVHKASMAIRKNYYDCGLEVIRITFDVNNGQGNLVNVAEVRHPRFGEMRIEKARLPRKHLVS